MRGPHWDRPAQPAGPPALLAGRLAGVRRWELTVDRAGGLRLRGPRAGIWQAEGKTTWAQCLRGFGGPSRRPHRDSAPAGGCCCGLYALHPWEATGEHQFGASPESQRVPVHGVIEAWGQVQLHREGFRAQYARPLTLVVFGEAGTSEYGRLVARLAESHRAELLKLADAAELISYCAERGLGLDRSAVGSLLDLESAPD